MDFEAMRGTIETVKACVFPLSAAVLFCVYPMVVLIWTIVEGRAASRLPKASAARSIQFKDPGCIKPVKNPCPGYSRAAPPLKKRIRGLQLSSGLNLSTVLGGAVVLAGLGAGTLAFTGHALSFVIGAASRPETCGQRGSSQATLPIGEQVSLALHQAEARTTSVSVARVVGGGAVLGMAVALGYGWSRFGRSFQSTKDLRSKLRRNYSSGVLRRCSSNSEVVYRRCEHPATGTQSGTEGVKRFSPPADGISMWHHVDLHVKSWLDEDTGLFHYVNEIPKGALQKFELQTKLENNVIREDPKGSGKLASFGQPVPFNYGCFPQTFRDPEEADDIFGAPGDDDPLDVLDLSPEAAGVGEVVCCRPLGAVCLIDEGQADWKVIVVNTNAKGPLASARTIEEAERFAPGRIEEALRWMDDFKQHRSNGESVLHYEIHDASRAVGIIEKDHAAWKRLVAKADVSGVVHGHWVRAAQEHRAQPQVMAFGWTPQLAVPGQMVNMPSSLAGASVPTTAQPSYAVGRALTMRRQISLSSDGGDSTSSMSDMSPQSSDSELA